jgi:hypothetical protein
VVKVDDRDIKDIICQPVTSTLDLKGSLPVILQAMGNRFYTLKLGTRTAFGLRIAIARRYSDSAVVYYNRVGLKTQNKISRLLKKSGCWDRGLFTFLFGGSIVLHDDFRRGDQEIG